jgi:hypothetical protein
LHGVFLTGAAPRDKGTKKINFQHRMVFVRPARAAPCFGAGKATQGVSLPKEVKRLQAGNLG